MQVSMVADLMSVINDPTDDIRILRNTPGRNKKCLPQAEAFVSA